LVNFFSSNEREGKEIRRIKIIKVLINETIIKDDLMNQNNPFNSTETINSVFYIMNACMHEKLNVVKRCEGEREEVKPRKKKEWWWW